MGTVLPIRPKIGPGFANVIPRNSNSSPNRQNHPPHGDDPFMKKKLVTLAAVVASTGFLATSAQAQLEDSTLALPAVSGIEFLESEDVMVINDARTGQRVGVLLDTINTGGARQFGFALVADPDVLNNGGDEVVLRSEFIDLPEVVEVPVQGLARANIRSNITRQYTVSPDGLEESGFSVVEVVAGNFAVSGRNATTNVRAAGRVNSQVIYNDQNIDNVNFSVLNFDTNIAVSQYGRPGVRGTFPRSTFWVENQGFLLADLRDAQQLNPVATAFRLPAAVVDVSGIVNPDVPILMRESNVRNNPADYRLTATIPGYGRSLVEIDVRSNSSLNLPPDEAIPGLRPEFANIRVFPTRSQFAGGGTTVQNTFNNVFTFTN